jgi:magnesium chelatase subunit D
VIEDAPAVDAEADAALAAALLAVDAPGLCGAVLRARVGLPRESWLDLLRSLMPAEAPWRRMPQHITEERLLGGLDLTATLRSGRRVLQRGLLSDADGGVVVVTMAERLPPTTAAQVGGVLDSGEVRLERDGLTARLPSRIAVVALDEGIEDDERAPAALDERVAFRVGFGSRMMIDFTLAAFEAGQVDAARRRLAAVDLSDEVLEALVKTAAALGVQSSRAGLFAVRAARAHAALHGRGIVTAEDAAAAARLVLAPRATQWPVPPEAPEAEPPPPPPPESDESPPADEASPPNAEDRPLEDRILEAAQAVIPAGLLERILAARSRSGASHGRVGQWRASAQRGRPIGARPGSPQGGARLDLIETLRAAAPWQRLRLAQTRAGGSRIRVSPQDFRIRRFKSHSETTTIFAVDASGSSALHRLAEVKGAVELLLAECYVRRDRVAVVSFRGAGVEVLLPPTRSLVRAKRSLAGLPGGGGTPLAGGIDAALAIALGVRRQGGTPTLVLLTDGRANLARDLTPGRGRAEAEALSAARALRAARISSVLIDTAPRPQPLAAELAAAMDARYVPLPHADASSLHRAVQTAIGPT